jgi:hypothetical protein
MICSRSSNINSGNDDLEEEDYRVRQCEYCQKSIAKVIIQISYDYDSNLRKDKVVKMYVCSKCHDRLNRDRMFSHKEIIRK